MAFPIYAYFIFSTFVMLATFTITIFANVSLSIQMWASQIWSTVTVIWYTGVWSSIAVIICITVYEQNIMRMKYTNLSFRKRCNTCYVFGNKKYFTRCSVKCKSKGISIELVQSYSITDKTCISHSFSVAVAHSYARWIFQAQVLAFQLRSYRGWPVIAMFSQTPCIIYFHWPSSFVW